jgi:flagellar hook-length control protein FliK
MSPGASPAAEGPEPRPTPTAEAATSSGNDPNARGPDRAAAAPNADDATAVTRPTERGTPPDGRPPAGRAAPVDAKADRDLAAPDRAHRVERVASAPIHPPTGEALSPVPAHPGPAGANPDVVQAPTVLAAANVAAPAASLTGTPPAANVPVIGDANAPAVPITGLAVEIVARVRDGKSRFEIRLDPPELGRIDVQLRVDRDGSVMSRLVVERADTLDLLRRDAASLERALNGAGLKTAEHGLEFSLRDHGLARHQGHRDEGDPTRPIAADEAPVAAPSHYGRRRGIGGGIDIRV